MARLDDGYQTTVSFSSAPSGWTVILSEKSVTPPGLDGGEANETTTMRNTTYRTFAPRNLITMTPMSFVGAYDDTVYSAALSLLNVLNQITVTFPDGKTLIFWGWLKEFTPNACEDGAQPTANITIIPSNTNDSGTETSPSGTVYD